WQWKLQKLSFHLSIDEQTPHQHRHGGVSHPQRNSNWTPSPSMLSVFRHLQQNRIVSSFAHFPSHPRCRLEGRISDFPAQRQTLIVLPKQARGQKQAVFDGLMEDGGLVATGRGDSPSRQHNRSCTLTLIVSVAHEHEQNVAKSFTPLARSETNAELAYGGTGTPPFGPDEPIQSTTSEFIMNKNLVNVFKHLSPVVRLSPLVETKPEKRNIRYSRRTIAI
ncbi:hypothetical protein HUJ05_006046, partial [Dendroctonus ponderosae]